MDSRQLWWVPNNWLHRNGKPRRRNLFDRIYLVHHFVFEQQYLLYVPRGREKRAWYLKCVVRIIGCYTGWRELHGYL
jgi:hypothetical protein